MVTKYPPFVWYIDENYDFLFETNHSQYVRRVPIENAVNDTMMYCSTASVENTSVILSVT